MALGTAMSHDDQRAGGRAPGSAGAGAGEKKVTTPAALAASSAATVVSIGTSSWQSTVRSAPPEAKAAMAEMASLGITRSFVPGTTTIELWPEASTQMGATPVVPPATVWEAV